MATLIVPNEVNDDDLEQRNGHIIDVDDHHQPCRTLQYIRARLLSESSPPCVHPQTDLSDSAQWVAALGDVNIRVKKCASELYEQYIQKRTTLAVGGSWLSAYAPTRSQDCVMPFMETNTHIAVCKWLQSWGQDTQTRLDESINSSSIFPGDQQNMRTSPRLRGHAEAKLLRLQSKQGYFLPTSEVTNALMICSPPCVGLTATVYAAANEAGLRVVEVNTSQLRSARGLSSLLNDVSQSHAIRRVESAKSVWDDIPSLPVPKKKGAPLKKGITQEKVNSFFGPKKKAAPVKRERVEEVVEESGPILPVMKPPPRSIPLIIFENCDVVMDDDVGFYTLIENVCGTAKCPVIMTCNQNKGGSLPNIECPVLHCALADSLAVYMSHPTDSSQFYFSESVHALMVVNSYGYTLPQDDLSLLKQFRLKSLLANFQFYLQHSDRQPKQVHDATPTAIPLCGSILRKVLGFDVTDRFVRNRSDPMGHVVQEEEDEVDALLRCSQASELSAGMMSLVDVVRAKNSLSIRDTNQLARFATAVSDSATITQSQWDDIPAIESIPTSARTFSITNILSKQTNGRKVPYKSIQKSFPFLAQHERLASIYAMDYKMVLTTS
jgi:hypothetical protein